MQGDMKIILEHLENMKAGPLYDCEYLAGKYSMEFPIQSCEELDAFEINLKKNKQLCSDTVSLNIIMPIFFNFFILLLFFNCCRKLSCTI